MSETVTRDIVAKLWNLCHILRDDGVTYNEYVTELTFLLFLKMMRETGHESRLPLGYRWEELAGRTGLDQLEYYRDLLLNLGSTKKTHDQTILSIFADANTKLRKPANLKALTTAIDKLDWFEACNSDQEDSKTDKLGDLYAPVAKIERREEKRFCRAIRPLLARRIPMTESRRWRTWLFDGRDIGSRGLDARCSDIAHPMLRLASARAICQVFEAAFRR